jgi:hypothetical protein
VIDVKAPDSPGWWLNRCSADLATERKRIDPLYDRYEGTAKMPASMTDAPAAAQRFYKTARTNLAQMLVRAPRYRMRVIGVLTDRTADEAGDVEAFDLFRRSGLAEVQHDVNRHSLIAGYGYTMSTEYKGRAAVTAEDPRLVITIHDPVFPAEILAGAKLFHDGVKDRDVAYLYRPEGDGATRRWVARRTRQTTAPGPIRVTASGWEWVDESGGVEGEVVPTPMPLVKFPNEEGAGEFERHLDILDRIDHLVLQGMVIATLQAWKQRAIRVDPKDMPDQDPKTGTLIDYNDVLSADPGALWKLPLTAELWESGAVDMGPITNMVTKDIERLSAVSFTPMSMFNSDATNQSATGASLVKEGLTTKVEDKQGRLDAPYALTLSLLGRIAGVESLLDPFKIRLRWTPAERYSLAEKADAGMKAKAAGMPWRTMMRVVWQMEPEEIERMASERMDDATLSSMLAAMAAGASAASTPAATPASAIEPAVTPEPELQPEPVV